MILRITHNKVPLFAGNLTLLSFTRNVKNWTFVQENCHLMCLSFIKNLLAGVLLHTVKYVMLNFAVITQWFSHFHNVWKIIIVGMVIFYFYFL